MEGNPKIVVCEYCNSQFLLEEDQIINYHIHQYGPGNSSPVNGRLPVQPIEPAEPPKKTSSPGAVGICVALVLFVGVLIFSLYRPGGSSSSKSGKEDYKPTYLDSGNKGVTDLEKEEEDGADAGHSPLWTSMVEAIFGKSADLVTEEELSRIKYISVDTNTDSTEVRYSFSDPYGEEAYVEESLSLPSGVWDLNDVVTFKGLKKLEVGRYWPDAEVMEKLENLQGIVCRGTELSDIQSYIAPEQLLELEAEDLSTLEGIGAFENLQILNVEDIYQPDLKQLVSLKNLKSLTLTESSSAPGTISMPGEHTGTMTDYSPLSVLTGLEELSLESECIRDLSFVKAMSGLKTLCIKDTECISVEPLAALTQLEELTLEDNSDVKDYEPLKDLSGLRSLVLDKSTSQSDPDLSSLSQLQKLEISGFISISFLRKMGNLEELSIHGCNIDEIEALAALTNLKRLSCYSDWTYSVPLRNVHFLDGMTGLTYLDFSGKGNSSFGAYGNNMEILGDISNVFNHPSLEEVYLNNCMFEINFDAVKDNETLKVLEMKEVSLKENFHVQSSNGMTDIWYDDVALDGNIDFLTHFTGLEKVYLDGNQLTTISFVPSLKHLTHLGINNNYVTDLTPLNQAEQLVYLDIRQNPVSGAVEAGDDVIVVR